MTEEKFQKILALREAYLSAKINYDDFITVRNSFNEEKPEVMSSIIELKMTSGKMTEYKKIKISASLARHFYHTELNRLRAVLFHAEHAFKSFK